MKADDRFFTNLQDFGSQIVRVPSGIRLAVAKIKRELSAGCLDFYHKPVKSARRKLTFGLKVTVNRSYTRRGVAVLIAILEQEGRHQVLEVPSWMFDLATCMSMPLVDHPYVGIKHLQALKELLKSAAEGTAVDMIRTQHLGSLRKGALIIVSAMEPRSEDQILS